MSRIRNLSTVIVVTAVLGLFAIPIVGAEESDASPPPVEAQPYFFALRVQDVEASSAWYRRVLGFEVVRFISLEERGQIRLLQRDGAFLQLIQYEVARQLPGLEPPLEKRYHLHGVFKIGFLVEDLDTAQARLKVLGIPLRGKVITEADGSRRSLQIEDPDGTVLQLFEILSKGPS